MPTPTIPAGNKYMNIALYTGNTPSTNAITGLGFAPDLVWTKSRSAAESHNLVNSVCGNNLRLRSNQTDAEASATFTLNSDGFTVGSNSESNTGSMVGWAWKAGGTAVSNTDGTIASSVSANQTSGFSVVTYTGSGAAGTVGHGLGVAPAMIITKKRTNAGGGSAATSWVVWQKAMSGAYSSTTAYAYMNSSSAASTTTVFYDGTAMTDSTFRWQTGNDNTNYLNDTFVSYCWAEIAGFSSFGSYTGNGSTDGPFVYTGFRPKFVMIKQSSASGENWTMYDSARNTYNSTNSVLFADTSSAEFTSTSYVPIDLVSNGFKIRTDGAGRNASGATYIYMAFAENPFKYANAR